MSVYETLRPLPRGSVTTFRVISAIEHVIVRLAALRNARATRNTLLRLSDQQLADIGLHRGAVDVLADRLAGV